MDDAMEMMGEMASKMDCCDDEAFTIEGQDDLKLTFNDLELDQQLFLLAFSTSYLSLFSEDSGLNVPSEVYPPPLLVQDFNILYEVFLI